MRVMVTMVIVEVGCLLGVMVAMVVTVVIVTMMVTMGGKSGSGDDWFGSIFAPVYTWP